jgi:hypothetical protein
MGNSFSSADSGDAARHDNWRQVCPASPAPAAQGVAKPSEAVAAAQPAASLPALGVSFHRPSAGIPAPFVEYSAPA